MIELKDLSFHIQDEGGERHTILNHINLQIADDSFVVITGPNGSGKSTLAKIIMGIEQPTSGQIMMNGQDITHLDVAERAERGIGFAFQQPVRFKGLTVQDLLCFAAGRRLSIDEACAYLVQVGLCAVDYVVRELDDRLSGGEMKRIEIAMLMAREAAFSIFDEPEAGIDLWSFQNLIRAFENLRKTTRGSLVVISHQERILEIAERIIVLEQGQVSEDGPPEDIMPTLMMEVDACQFYGRRLAQ